MWKCSDMIKDYTIKDKRISTSRTWNTDYREDYKICIHKIIKDIRKNSSYKKKKTMKKEYADLTKNQIWASKSEKYCYCNWI